MTTDERIVKALEKIARRMWWVCFWVYIIAVVFFGAAWAR